MIISGGEKPQNIQRALNSISKYVDGIFIVITTEDENDLQKLCKDAGATVDYLPNKFHHKVKAKEVKWIKKFCGYTPKIKAGDELFQFDKARNYAMNMIPKEYEYFVWLDSDDVFQGGENLKGLVKLCEECEADSVFLNYIYEAEIKDGKIKSILIEHLRERLIKNNGKYKWVAPIHETLIEQTPTKKIERKECSVLHLAERENRLNSIERNGKSLEYAIYLKRGDDPRPTYYLAKVLFDLGEYDNALSLLYKYLNGTKEYDYRNRSGWAEERMQCREYISEIYRLQGKYDEAIASDMDALKETETFPSTYLGIAQSYVLKREWDRALHWVKIASKIDMPNTTLIKNPRDIAARTLEIIYSASLHKSKLDEAWAAAVKLEQMFPDIRLVQERLNFVNKIKQSRDLTKSYVEIAKFLDQTGQGHKIKPLVLSSPDQIKNNPFIADLVKKVNPTKVWGEDEIVIYCGPGFTQWSGKTIEDPKGSFIGGSEEAVIYLSQELNKLGWKVTVYADPGDEEGTYNGVTYLPHYKFNRDDDFNVFIGWRAIQIFDLSINSKKNYLWLHDVPNVMEFTEDRLKKINKIFVLSEFHRSLLSKIEDDKFLLTSNGINL